VAALLFAYSLSRKVLKESEGTPLMQKLAAAIRLGANAYLKRQYSSVAKFFAVVFVIMLALVFFD
jgi:K(+)-stimulated pyrophosphate-energized sodium pump